MNELAPRQVKITDTFWSPRLAVNAGHAIFHQWRELEKSGCLANFSFLTGDKDGFREGWFFADSDVYKWLDAAARIYASAPDEPLKALMNECIELFARAQTPGGRSKLDSQKGKRVIPFNGIYCKIKEGLKCTNLLKYSSV